MRSMFLVILFFIQALTVNAQSAVLKGEFAAIQVAESNKMAARVLGKDQSAIDTVIKAPGAYTPPVLYVLSQALFDAGNKKDAVFWFYVGQLRAKSDANKALDTSSKQAVAILNQRFYEINHYALRDSNRLFNTIDKVLKFDRENPRSYDPRWIALHGMDVFSKSKVAFSPRAEWPEIDKKTRVEYLMGFNNAFDRMKNGGWPERPKGKAQEPDELY